MKMEQTECSETSAHKIQTQGNRPKERIQNSGHGDNFDIKNYYGLFLFQEESSFST